jgi:hypothetical protein
MRTKAVALTLRHKIRHSLWWLPAWAWHRIVPRQVHRGVQHLLIAIADHFEPSIVPESSRSFAPPNEQERRLERWCREYPHAMEQWRDADGFPLRHTYFYPAEQHDAGLIRRLAEHCHAGWGEIEIHLHHGVDAPDNPDNTEAVLTSFRDTLENEGCLSRWGGKGPARYAFVHGNWALANSAGGRYCGIDGEMEILARTGCYADLTLPSAPSPAQVAKINALYECALPLSHRAPHRKGRDLRVGTPPLTYPLIIQGPLGVTFQHPRRGWPVPAIENSELSNTHPPTPHRLRLWRREEITVKGRPDWLFIKLHCHGMDPRDEAAMFGASMQRFLEELLRKDRTGAVYKVHFVTAREMVNIALAACDGKDGDPGAFRDYRLKLVTPSRVP